MRKNRIISFHCQQKNVQSFEFQREIVEIFLPCIIKFIQTIHFLLIIVIVSI